MTLNFDVPELIAFLRGSTTAGARHGDHDRSPYGVGAPRLVARRTLVIFTSNHGKMLGDQGIYRKGPYSYDQAVSLPGTISGGWASDALITDLAPTLADAAGLPVPASMPGPLLGGRSSPATGRSPRCARTPTARLQLQHHVLGAAVARDPLPERPESKLIHYRAARPLVRRVPGRVT